MGTLPSRRERKLREQLIEDQVSVNELESKVEEKVEMDVLKLPSRSEIFGKKEKQNKGPTRREKQAEKEVFSTIQNEEIDEAESYATPQRRKKSFPLVNLLFILFFLIVIAVSTYPLWIGKLF